MAQEDSIPEDNIFQKLFVETFNQIKEDKKDDPNESLILPNKMDEYTSNFFKIVIRIFQTSRKFLNLDNVKSLVDQLITGDKLLVVVNSLPLYLAIQMFFDAEQINQSETGGSSIIIKVHQVI